MLFSEVGEGGVRGFSTDFNFQITDIKKQWVTDISEGRKIKLECPDNVSVTLERLCKVRN